MTMLDTFATVDDLIAGIDAANENLIPYEYASAATVSQFTEQVLLGDNPSGGDDVIGISAVVYENKLFSLSIADDWLTEADALSTMINAVIAQTFYRYSQQYEINVQAARDFIEQHPKGREEAIKQMRSRIALLRED